MKLNGWLAGCIGALVALPLARAQEADKPACAVLTFTGRGNVSASDADMLSDRFAIEFDKLGQYKLIARARMKDILAEQAFSTSKPCAASECAVEAGQMLGVRYMVYSSIGKIGEIYSINSFMVDVETALQVRSATSDTRGGIEDALTVLMAANAAELLGKEAPKKTQAPRPAVADESRREDPNEPMTMHGGSPPAARSPYSPRVPAAESPGTDGFRFALGLTYMSGLTEVSDFIFDEVDAEDELVVPVGLSFVAGYEFSHGSRIAFDLGPAAVILLNSELEYWDVPLGLSYGFTFIPAASVSPYARVGFKYHIVGGGDWVGDSTPGFFVAAGIEFARTKPVGFGLEIAYDASEINLTESYWEEGVRPGQVLVSARAVF